MMISKTKFYYKENFINEYLILYSKKTKNKKYLDKEFFQIRRGYFKAKLIMNSNLKHYKKTIMIIEIKFLIK